jgi:hypothetical protein
VLAYARALEEVPGVLDKIKRMRLRKRESNTNTILRSDKKNIGTGHCSLIHNPTVVLYLSYRPATKFFDENSEMSGVLIPVYLMMSLGIKDVIILTDDTTATFFSRITKVSQTMTFAHNFKSITTAYLSHLHHWKTYTVCNLTKNHARINTVA